MIVLQHRAPVAGRVRSVNPGASAQSVVGFLGVGIGVGVALATAALALPGWHGAAALVAVPVVLLLLPLALRDPRGGIALFAAGLPAGLTTLAGGVQVVQVLAALTVVLVASARLLQGVSPLRVPPAVIATFALVTWSLLTTPVAADLPRALRWNASLFVAALLVAAVVTAASGSLARLRHVALMLFAGSVATCAMALPESTQRRSFGAAVVDGRAQGVFSQPNELGLFAGTTVVLGLALLVAVGEARHPGLQRLAVVLGGLVALVALALSLSRGAWIGTLLALLVAGVLVAPIRRVLLGVVVAVTLGLSVLVAGNALPAQLDVIVARASLITDRDSNPYDARPAIWAEGVRQVREHPLVGGGPAGFTDASAGSSSMVVAFVRPAHAHNVILNFSAESGVPAGLALLAVTLLTAKAVVRGRARAGWSTRQRGLLSALGCLPLVVLGQGTIDAPLRNPTTLLHTAAVLGLAISVGSVRLPTGHASPAAGSARVERDPHDTHG